MQSRITFNSQLKIALSLNRDNHDSISLRTNLFVVITANHQGWLEKFITTWIKKRVCRVKWEGLHTNCHTWREAVRIEYNIWRHSRLCERHVLNRPLLAKREKKKWIILTVSRLSRFKLFFYFFFNKYRKPSSGHNEANSRRRWYAVWPHLRNTGWYLRPNTNFEGHYW